jgi:hypothetical protein
MADSLRTDGSRAFDAAPDADRDAKIEQLLLIGLDHYFAGQYEHAINVWTRALFLDRSHARARAYIERARSALAERQRESEELLHKGVAAYREGHGDEARRLLQAAIDGGAPADEALALLDRLHHLDPSPAPAPTRSVLGRRRSSMPHTAERQTTAGLRLALGVVVVLALALAGVSAATWRLGDWRSLLTIPEMPRTTATQSLDERLPPVPARGETALLRAHSLAASGRLRDALAALDAVRPTDPQKTDADRLRADIQRQLLSLVSIP